MDFYSKKHNKPIQKIEPGIIEKLQSYPFPGNVRELKHLTERAVILSDGGSVQARFFSLRSHLIDKDWNTNPKETPVSMDAMERDLIVMALREAKNNKSKAARILNISRQALDRRINKYNISLRG